MEVFKRYLIIFVSTSTALYLFIFWYESQNPGVAIPHNLTDATEESIAINLPPSNAYEKCVQLETKQPLQYSFEAEAPLVFNVHYHIGKKDYYPIEETAAAFSSTFVPEEPRIYCLMWGNRNDQQVRLQYEFQVQDIPTTATR
jgi:hypothetical protein